MMEWKEKKEKLLAGWGIAAGKTGNKPIAYQIVKQHSSHVFAGSLDRVAFMVEHLQKLHLSSYY